MVNIEELKTEAERVLKDGKVKYIIGYRQSSNHLLAAPAFFKNPDEIKNLIWDPSCLHNLVKFLPDEKRRKNREKKPDERPVGLMVKGCDSRAVNVLLQEKFINRDDVYLFGVSCENSGVIDEKRIISKLNGKGINQVEFKNSKIMVTTEDQTLELPIKDFLADRCRECKANFPVVYDILLGEKTKRSNPEPYESLKAIDDLSQEERWNFWKEQLGKCIRCYACRSVCPMCFCDECVVDTISFAISADTTAEEKAQRIKWIDKSPVTSENFGYHLIRALHLAGRCIDCGECERVCPLAIPIRFLNKKLEKVAKELFDYDVGFDPEQASLVSCFKDDDPEDFIR